jgi:hypothetical protein
MSAPEGSRTDESAVHTGADPEGTGHGRSSQGRGSIYPALLPRNAIKLGSRLRVLLRSDLKAQVQQAQQLADQGMVMTFQVDVDPHTPEWETSLAPGEDGSPQFDLFDPDEIRLEQGSVPTANRHRYQR